MKNPFKLSNNPIDHAFRGIYTSLFFVWLVLAEGFVAAHYLSKAWRLTDELDAARRALEARPILVESPPPDTQNCLCVLPNDRAYFECRMRLKETP